MMIPLPWRTPPLRANDRRSWPAQHRARAQAVIEARWAVKAADTRPVVGAEATLHYRPKTRRRQDADGLAPTLKVVLDAVVLEGVLPDDSWVEVPRATCQIWPPDSSNTSELWLELKVLTEYEGARNG